MGGENHFVFAFMGAGGDPHRTLAGLPLCPQVTRAGQQLLVDAQIELDRAGHLHALRTCPQLAKALGFGLGLHGNKVHLGQHRPGQPGKAGVATGRTLGQSRIGQGYRDTALGALVDVIGPKLGLHDYRQPGLDMIKEAPGGPRQVIGQVTMLDPWLVGEHRLHTLRAGRGHAGDGDRQLWISLEQRADHRRCGNAFAHRHGMHPDPALGHGRQVQGKAFADALSISRRLA